MAEIYRVAVHYGNDNGFVEYNLETKTIKVDLAHDEKRREAEEYLAKEHTIAVAQDGIRDFKDQKVNAAQDVESFKLALTRMWEAIDLHVDWSRPA
ncbi:hypothetical protein SDC9_15056 [bioreactor metagenome]|uniref:Uncharacterized protein n=1 Tax=bioreactor metagenome TaxID=1076179 RepID=A0A644TRQ2_9ZZZZ|nr:hypothetical protein [Negativicutes bacterium]